MSFLSLLIYHFCFELFAWTALSTHNFTTYNKTPRIKRSCQTKQISIEIKRALTLSYLEVWLCLTNVFLSNPRTYRYWKPYWSSIKFTFLLSIKSCRLLLSDCCATWKALFQPKCCVTLQWNANHGRLIDFVVAWFCPSR